MKAALIQSLPQWNWVDLGPDTKDRVDYPDFAQLLAEKLMAGEANDGVLICGSGIGMSIAANKFPGIRAALVENPSAARLAKEHNQANVLCLASRFTAPEYGAEMIEAWQNAKPSKDPRHARRVKKLQFIEEKGFTE